MKFQIKALSLAVLSGLASYSYASDNDIETIIVTGDFKKENIQTLSASASVINDQEVALRGATYLDEVLNTAANVNFTAGASRGRFVQVRGVGMRSQFVDPVNPSVGVIVDGINYSGLAGAALLFDIDQVEIYRGPQGTRFGADALAGMIHMNSAATSIDPTVNLKLGAGNYNSMDAGVAFGLGVEDMVSTRTSIYQSNSDGYTENLYLNEATQDRDEFVARFKAKTEFSDKFSSQLTVHRIDINNGYDGFTLDNSRNSVADEPGQDNQQSDAFALANQFSHFDLFDVNLNISAVDSELLYSYDEDWVCNDAAQAVLCEAGLHDWGYSSTDEYYRDRKDRNIELNFTDKQAQWILGSYYQTRDVDLKRVYTWQSNDFLSTYEANTYALFGQKETTIDDRTVLITGLRFERNEGDYQDNNGFAESHSDSMVGGKLALEHTVNSQAMIYTSLSRGYKAGGINGEAMAKAKGDGVSGDSVFFENHSSFEPEYLWNAEFGVRGRSKDNDLSLRVTAFYMHRDNMQLKEYKTYQAGEGENQAPVFVGFIGNAASGENYGLEVDGDYRFNEKLSFTGSFGYLKTKVDKPLTADEVAEGVYDIDGRAQAQAPRYQYAVVANYDVSEQIFINLGVEGKDEYFFSDSHSSKSDRIHLVNASIGYRQNNWQLTAWLRNAFDKEYAVRGFEFGNDPRDGYETHTYTQLGEPQVMGVTFNYQY